MIPHSWKLLLHRLKAWLACLWYRYPANTLIVIGVTGTNGKTTTVNLVTKMLEKAGHKVGLASTINFRVDRKEWQNATHKTTLGPFQLQKLLRKMVNAGCKYAVIETSSHALAQHRVTGVSYDVAAITNVTPEHLDYHKSMRAYRAEKIKLFENLMLGKHKRGVKKVAILNGDDQENYEYFVRHPADWKISYGLKNKLMEEISDQIFASDVQLFADHTDLTLRTPKEEKQLRTYLPGEFNVENILAATAIAYSQGVGLEAVEKALKEVRLIPGRMESIDEGQNFRVYIDFAMTEDGYGKLLKTLRKTTEGKLWVVFGCCGDRDQKKRPKIGEICGALADKVIVCDDEPYTEDPSHIREMILEGLEHSRLKKDEGFFEIPDRAKAIAFACGKAEKGDTVVVPGMGDFEGRTFADGIRPWNEREEIRKALRTRTAAV
ncbi:MAG: UDP-N-acetylmuramoyl-L-alanyl-D-glutamate--2,6-diaminopimelate ligase [bacterium]|nr:UDP-N-acetylmuramoyl-L-alanyl-D-glutamate--2,6-diaminopimelate ligase [bacterium]